VHHQSTIFKLSVDCSAVTAGTFTRLLKTYDLKLERLKLYHTSTTLLIYSDTSMV